MQSIPYTVSGNLLTVVMGRCRIGAPSSYANTIARLLAALVILMFFQGRASAEDEFRIGVLAKRGKPACLKQWKQTAKYLSMKIDDACFQVVPLDFEEIYTTIEQESVDFIIVNPALYVELSMYYNVQRIATLKKNILDRSYTTSAGVVFTRRSNKALRTWDDLKGKSFMAVKENSFGGWLMARYELQSRGIDPYRAFSDLSFSGTHDSVVYAVLDGRVAAGTVRTGILESMQQEGKISINDLHILPDRESDEVCYPLLHSTRAYPEWPIAKLSGTPNSIAEKVVTSLLSMEPDHLAAVTAGLDGWTIPLNYQPVRDCLKKLRYGPFRRSGTITVKSIFRQYRPWILIFLLLSVIILTFLSYGMYLNASLRTSKKKLEDEIDMRIQTEHELKASQNMLQIVLDTIPVRVFWKNRESVYMGCNRQFAQDAGLAATSDIIGLTDYDLPWFKQAKQLRADDDTILGFGKPQLNYEAPQVYPDGQTYWLKASKIPLKNIHHETTGVLGCYENITDQKVAEDRLRASEERFRILVQTAPDAIVLSNTSNHIIFANQVVREMFGYEPEELIGNHTGMLVPEEFRASDREHFKKINRVAGEPVFEKTFEAHGKRENGTVFPLEMSLSSGTIGKNRFYCAIIRDITERKKAEEALRTTRDQLTGVIEDSLDAIIITDEHGTVVRANKAFTAMLGMQQADIIGQSATIYTPSRPGTYRSTAGEQVIIDQDCIDKNYYSMRCFLDQGMIRNWEAYFQHADGMLLPIEANMVLLYDKSGDSVGAVGIIRDITERRRAEIQIKRQSAVLEAINNVFQEMIACETAEDVARTCLTVAEKITGSRFGWIGEINDRGTIGTIALSDLGWTSCRMPESDKARLTNDLPLKGFWCRVIKEKTSLIANEPASHPDSLGTPEGHPPIDAYLGVPLIYDERAFGIISLANRPGGYTEDDARDIEALALPFIEALMRKRTNIMLNNERKQLLSIFDSINAAIYVVDTTTYDLLFINRYMREMLDIETIDGKCYTVLMGFSCPCDFCTKNLLAEDPEKTYRWEFFSKHLSRHFMVHDRIIKWSDGRDVKFSMALDISDRKEAEQKIQEFARELEQSNQDLNDFAYIASHDLKEPLRGIHNYASFLIEDYEDKLDAEGGRMLRTLTTLTKRLEALIESLLEYSRVGRLDLSFHETDLNTLVRDVIETLKIRLEEQGVDVRVPRPLPNLYCDTTRIQEVYRNFISNAMKYNDKEEKWIEIGYTEYDTVSAPVLYVRDNGIGIREKHRDAVFKIFKRLHARDKFDGGTGAGLTIVKKIIERHNGRIWIESVPGEGTTFYFTIEGKKRESTS